MVDKRIRVQGPERRDAPVRRSLHPLRRLRRLRRCAFSNARTGETLAAGNAAPHFGLEHFAIEVDDIEAEIKRLQKLGAKFQEGPLRAPNGVLFAFLGAPDDVRLELVQLPK